MRVYEFTINGQRFRGTDEQVIEALRGVQPEAPRTHVVEVGGVRYPVKQALWVAFGVDRADFISNEARRVLRHLGFRVDRL